MERRIRTSQMHESFGSNPTFASVRLDLLELKTFISDSGDKELCFNHSVLCSNPTNGCYICRSLLSCDGLVVKHMFSVCEAALETWVQILPSPVGMILNFKRFIVKPMITCG